MNKESRRPYTMVTRAKRMASTRKRIIDAMLTLALDQPYEDITLAAIAQTAGVSHQTVLNHFESKEGVAAAAAAALASQTGAARDKAKPGDTEGAVAVLVGEYERIGDANAQWAMASDRLGSLAALLDDARAGHQAWLERIFADLLPTPRIARRRAINALHAATDVYTWKLLRRDLRLSRRETERTMVDLVSGILRAGPRQKVKRRNRARSGR